MVLRGTSEFKMEVMALSISVSAMANKNAGKNDPKKPEIAIHFHCGFLMFFRLLYPKANKITPVSTLRKLPI